MDPIKFFSDKFIKEVVPFDTKLASLKKSRDFGIQGEFFRIFVEDFSLLNNTTKEELEKQLKKNRGFEYYAKIIQENYFKELKNRYEHDISISITEDDKKSINKSIKEDRFVDAIEKLEEILGLKHSLSMQKISEHSLDCIYDIERNNIVNGIKKITEALQYFVKYYQPLEDSKDYLDTIDYISLSITHELWNFLTHVSYAYSIFNTPTVFISNIKKAISHLNRATLDVYDGLIIEQSKYGLGFDYLDLRMLKLESLGDSSKIRLLIEELEKYYVKHILQK